VWCRGQNEDPRPETSCLFAVPLKMFYCTLRRSMHVSLVVVIIIIVVAVVAAVVVGGGGVASASDLAATSYFLWHLHKCKQIN